MIINQERINTLTLQFWQLQKALMLSAADCQAGLDSGFSAIAGVSETGGIHGRLLRDDPGSARSILLKLDERTCWLHSMLSSTTDAIAKQDLILKVSLDHLAKVAEEAIETFGFLGEPDSNVPQVYFLPPIVALSPDYNTAVAEILALDKAKVVATTAAWLRLAGTADDVNMQLVSMANSIEAVNQGAVFDAAVRRFRETAARLNQFGTNARVMAGHTGAMSSVLGALTLNTVAQTAVIKSIPEPVERKAAEKAALVLMQSHLQTAVDVSLPSHGNLMGELGRSARAGGDIDAGISSHAGFRDGLDTTEITWPKAIAEAAERNELGPGSFEVVDGTLKPVSSVGMPAEQQPQLDTAVGQIRQQLQQATTDFPPMGLDATSTGLASHASGPSPSTSPFLTTGGTSTGNNLGAATYSPGSASSTIGTSGGINATGANGQTLQGLGSNNFGQGGAHAGRISLGGAGGSAGGLGSGNTNGPAGGLGSNAGGSPLTGAGSSGGAQSTGTGAGMGAGAGGGNRGKEKQGQIRSITTKIEAEPNLKALLGELPPAIPGVIGAWVRDQ